MILSEFCFKWILLVVFPPSLQYLQYCINLQYWFAGNLPTPGIPAIFRVFSTLYIYQSADSSAHSMAFQCVCVYVASTSTSQIQTVTAADVKLHRTSIPPCSVISLWLRAMLSQYPIFGGEVLCLHNPIGFRVKHVNSPGVRLSLPGKLVFSGDIVDTLLTITNGDFWVEEFLKRRNSSRMMQTLAE